MPPLSAGRPPLAQLKKPLAYNGRPVVAGVGSFRHQLSVRATVADLWSTFEIAAASGSTPLQRAGQPALDPSGQARLRAYVRQAREYFLASRAADPSAKPLLAYYFALNLTKAYLTACDPQLTAGKISHGASSPEPTVQGVYDFTHEHLRPLGDGVLRELARGRGVVSRGRSNWATST
jgi:hypothetical protein